MNDHADTLRDLRANLGLVTEEREALDAVIAALEAGRSGEAVLVPRQLTDAMAQATVPYLGACHFGRLGNAYAAMLAAAPQQPVGVTERMLYAAASAYVENGMGGSTCSHSAMRAAIEAALSHQQAAPSVCPDCDGDGVVVVRRGPGSDCDEERPCPKCPAPVSEPAASDGQRAVEEYERARRLTTTGGAQ